MSKTHALQIQNQRIFWTLAVFAFAFAALYGYFVNAAILNAVARQKSQTTISMLSSQTGDLESQYLGLKSSINLNLAYAMGFKDADTQFINRDTLSFNSR